MICFLITSWSIFKPGPNLPGESIFIIPELLDIIYTPKTNIKRGLYQILRCLLCTFSCAEEMKAIRHC